MTGDKIATITEADARVTAAEREQDCGCGDVAQHLADVYEDYDVIPEAGGDEAGGDT